MAQGKRVDNREFVVAYLTSETLDDVARTVGMTKPGVQAKVKALRKLGVNLPKNRFRCWRGTTQLEIAQLNDLIRKYQEQQGGAS